MGCEVKKKGAELFKDNGNMQNKFY